jgi:hypothetical protein
MCRPDLKTTGSSTKFACMVTRLVPVSAGSAEFPYGGALDRGPDLVAAPAIASFTEGNRPLADAKEHLPFRPHDSDETDQHGDDQKQHRPRRHAPRGGGGRGASTKIPRPAPDHVCANHLARITA